MYVVPIYSSEIFIAEEWFVIDKTMYRMIASIMCELFVSKLANMKQALHIISDARASKSYEGN